MADFNCPEMAAVDGSGRFKGSKYYIGGVGRDVRRKRSVLRDHRLGVGCALVLTMGSLLMSALCLRSQRQLEAENSVLRVDFEVLENQMLTVEKKLSETVAFGRSADEQHWFHQSRPKRSTGENRRRRNSKAAHYRLDVGVGSTTTELIWALWNGPDTTSDRSNAHYSLESARLSDDRKSVTVTEPGLYFIYAQIHFENARRRNAFAVKVDSFVITKCFQSLDYFNQSVNATENAQMKTCYSAATVVLRRNQVVSLENLYPHHRILNDPYANYWGIVRFGDA